MNEALTAMILSLLENSQKEVSHAGTIRNGGTPDLTWQVHMISAIMLRCTAEALQEGRNALR